MSLNVYCNLETVPVSGTRSAKAVIELVTERLSESGLDSDKDTVTATTDGTTVMLKSGHPSDSREDQWSCVRQVGGRIKPTQDAQEQSISVSYLISKKKVIDVATTLLSHLFSVDDDMAEGGDDDEMMDEEDGNTFCGGGTGHGLPLHWGYLTVLSRRRPCKQELEICEALSVRTSSLDALLAALHSI